MRRLIGIGAAVIAAAGGLSAAAGAAPTGAATPAPIASCAFGQSGAYLQKTVDQDAAAYAATREPATQQLAEKAYAAAAAAYVYGMPMEIERLTLKGFVRNVLINVNALATPSTVGVVSPNVDTAYSVSWIDLTNGPVVFTAPDSNGRFYTVQFMDAYTNAFAYVGDGSTGIGGGAYALVPPGWSGTLPAGVTKIQSPTNTIWLLGRTLVNGPSDFPAVKQVQERYNLTPLSLYETGVREPALTISSYPAGKHKALPTGTAFIDTLNQELTIDPPPAADDCALAAMTPAGVELSHPTETQSAAADLENIAGDTPTGQDDAVTQAAVDAGVAAGPQLIAAAASRLVAQASAGNHGWAILNKEIGTYGSDYTARAVIGTDYLGANIPSQGLYPVDYDDVTGRTLTGASDYTITFPKGLEPPARAFWSLTVYDSANYLYANTLDRYAIGNRTSGLVYGKDGSLTLHIQHAEPPTAAARANWLPAPSGVFHVMLRLYQPTAAALDETWKPPPLFAAGETLRPALSGLSLHGSTLAYRDNQPARTQLVIRSAFLGRIVARIAHRDRAGLNRVTLRRLRAGVGEYVVRAVATGPVASYDTAPSRPVSLQFELR